MTAETKLQESARLLRGCAVQAQAVRVRITSIIEHMERLHSAYLNGEDYRINNVRLPLRAVIQWKANELARYGEEIATALDAIEKRGEL